MGLSGFRRCRGLHAGEGVFKHVGQMRCILRIVGGKFGRRDRGRFGRRKQFPVGVEIADLAGVQRLVGGCAVCALLLLRLIGRSQACLNALLQMSDQVHRLGDAAAEHLLGDVVFGKPREVVVEAGDALADGRILHQVVAGGFQRLGRGIESRRQGFSRACATSSNAVLPSGTAPPSASRSL